MLDIFKRLARVFKRRRVQTDSLVFRLHYSVTVAFLLLFCVIVTFNQYFRRPVVCRENGTKDNMLNEFCLTQSKFVPQEIPDRADASITVKKGERETITLKYYQWISIYLFFQAILFYVPRFLWKNWEGGKLRALRNFVNVGFMTEYEQQDKKAQLAAYLHDHRHSHTWWTYQYLLCEALALINVLGQMFFLDKLFDGKFWSLGQEVLNYTESNSTDPVTQLFPRSGQCLYYLYGASGVMQLYSTICVLSLNILYAKIFVFLWFWFVMLLIVTSAWIIFRFAMVTIPWIRRFLLYIRCGCHVQKYTIYRIVACSNVGDWFFLNMVGQNVDTVLFSEVLKDLANKLGEEKASDLEFKMSRFSNINE